MARKSQPTPTPATSTEPQAAADATTTASSKPAAKRVRPRERSTFGVRRKDGTGPTRMVDAFVAGSALRHVAEDVYVVKRLSIKEAIALGRSNVEVEVAGETAEAAAEGDAQ